MSRRSWFVAAALFAVGLFVAAECPCWAAWGEPSAGEKKTVEALNSPTQLQFIETPLQDVVDYLRQLHRIEIQIDNRALEDVGIATDTLITRNLKRVSLRSALNLMLGELDLDFVIADEVLLITTAEEAESRIYPRVYPVADLLDGRGGSASPERDCESLIHVITCVAARETWEDVGGPGSITTIPPGSPRSLVVRQHRRAHEQVVLVLDLLRRAAEVKPGSGPRPMGFRVSAAEKRIAEELNSPTQLNFIDTPLQDVLDHLKAYHDIEIQIDYRALDDVGIGADTPITKRLKGLSLRSALRLILRDLDLAHVIQDEVLLITTPEEVETRLKTVIYPVGDLVRGRREVSQAGESYGDALAELIIGLIQPTTWDEVRRPGSIAPLTMGTLDALLVINTPEVHQEIAGFLARPEFRQSSPAKPQRSKPVFRRRWLRRR